MKDYTVPALTRAEVMQEKGHDPSPADCGPCFRRSTPVDHWPTSICNSSFRRDGQGTERLFRVHCTCALCF
ncbi:hypothetical protein ACFY0N_00780 [Streptomyces vinaceus]|uniref:hypothetical protein n=1 Tax=Streptomyces vinaceus TaxID=1960 RepID=UPI00368AE5DA